MLISKHVQLKSLYLISVFVHYDAFGCLGTALGLSNIGIAAVDLCDPACWRARVEGASGTARFDAVHVFNDCSFFLGSAITLCDGKKPRMGEYQELSSLLVTNIDCGESREGFRLM